jgi:hypothetical protein
MNNEAAGRYVRVFQGIRFDAFVQQGLKLVEGVRFF